jgi:hypothetical protein
MYLDGQRKNTAQHQRSNKTCYDAKNQTEWVPREDANKRADPDQDYRDKPVQNRDRPRRKMVHGTPSLSTTPNRVL